MKKTGLALSGGGSLGIAHVGAIKALEPKYQFEHISGVSAGAMVGAALALGKNADEIWQIIQETNLFEMVFDISLRNSGLVKGQKIHAILDEIYEGRSFQDTNTPLYIGATNFETGTGVIIDQGKIADAVRASIAIPLVFEPYTHPLYGGPLVDGFLSQNLPLDPLLKHYKGSSIIAIDVSTVPKLPQDFGKKKFWGRDKMAFQSMQRTIRIMYHNQIKYQQQDSRVHLIEPDLDKFSSMTLGKKNFQKIYDQGYKSAIEA